MKQTAEFFCHLISEPTYLEAGLKIGIGQDRSITKNFTISVRDNFLAVIPESSFSSEVTASRFNYLAFLFESLADWLNIDLDYEIFDVDFEEKTGTLIKFIVNCSIEGKKERLVFEFENKGNQIDIVFSSNHSGETFMQIAIFTVADYLVNQINTSFNLN